MAQDEKGTPDDQLLREVFEAGRALGRVEGRVEHAQAVLSCLDVKLFTARQRLAAINTALSAIDDENGESA